ncbi:MAG TPA: DNA methyltransferase, partial [Thermoanaerobaculia bacterium]|nr:DNA methyltransferase [Thermoanaerobaculia bacterium]
MAKRGKSSAEVKGYKHEEAEVLLRPDVGTQAQFRKKKPPAKYRYDSSLSPALDWDGQNSARERGEALIREILEADSIEKAKAAAAQLESISRPFLNWAGKAERLSFDVPTLPLFVHERLSTKAILETLKGHRREKQESLFDLFSDPQHSITDQVLRAYEHRDKWVNRMILGDSLVVMNSLLHYEGLGGQVQMIYIDPPYGVKFGSNFQPFVRKRDVSHNDDEDMTREPEMVQAYRDTWELGLHSYLTYLRDRLLLARELLRPEGSVFVQIGDENLHHVRELLDDLFGGQNFISLVTFQKTTGQTSELLPGVSDYLLWYGRDRERTKFRQLYSAKTVGGEATGEYVWVRLPDGTERILTSEERREPLLIPEGGRVFRQDSMVSQGYRENTTVVYSFRGKEHYPGPTNNWKTTPKGLDRLAADDRLVSSGRILKYKRFIDDFPVFPVANTWTDTTTGGSSTDPRVYVVQTVARVIQRALLMTTDPGDLVVDPTCGSGTTAYVAEQWGRRWIAIDTSRVPLALARQRLLTAT